MFHDAKDPKGDPRVIPVVQSNTHGILVAIDFEKAFASLNHNFLFKALEKFNFAPHFIQWITTSHADIFKVAINNGF